MPWTCQQWIFYSKWLSTTDRLTLESWGPTVSLDSVLTQPLLDWWAPGEHLLHRPLSWQFPRKGSVVAENMVSMRMIVNEIISRTLTAFPLPPFRHLKNQASIWIVSCLFVLRKRSIFSLGSRKVPGFLMWKRLLLASCSLESAAVLMLDAAFLLPCAGATTTV